MKSLAVRACSGSHLGFILFSGSQQSGDCIFQVLPTESDVFGDSSFQFLEPFGFRIAGEHRWSRVGDEIQLSLSGDRMAAIDLIAGELKFASGEVFHVVPCGQKNA